MCKKSRVEYFFFEPWRDQLVAPLQAALAGAMPAMDLAQREVAPRPSASAGGAGAPSDTLVISEADDGACEA